ncbi:hypothetical protein [Chitinophaga cymbidii]|uniref:Uncharacterized protein n=1 Tax=Chitinophaga cymbidii TaxID=1096750 RepID=A0A512RFQ4_9BACT|nr:hypothetical protein [Chitinophaga cymbidii]GEP94543.1 hypothetical protein CCY01nite_08030 [Chitinophaga cymbidii]
MNGLRWDPSVLIRGDKTSEFWSSHFNSAQRSVLFILGKGFDVRMNIAIQELIKNCPTIKLECWLIEFDEGTGSNSTKYLKHVQENEKELSTYLTGKQIVTKKISLWNSKVKGKRKRIGDRQAAQILESYEQIKQFTDIIIDISALPRGVYFSLVGKFLTFIDNYAKDKKPNLFVVVSENADIDSKIKEKGIDEDVGYLHGFGGTLELTSESEEPVIWFPILGEDKAEHLDKAYTHIRPNEICPVLPFPSKNPRRSDALIKDYYQLLFDRLNIESQNIMYVPEQNPFEAYIRLTKAIRNYNTSLQALDGCKAVISTFSSKLLSIGSLLTAYELINEIGVGILNVDSQGYDIDSFDDLKSIKDNSELFVIWLIGEAYET